MKNLLIAVLTLVVCASAASADQVILDDLIVDGSACIGFDCVNGESFGFDTIRLKENNLRIRFVDTSSSASFPTNDWQLTANDSANGGANKFSIDDIDGGRTPFTIEAGAPSHSLYVDDGGRLGLGTSTPVTDLHVKSGNTPTMRLDQDGSSGFTPQIWDVAGNEANFFIRDATNGSTLPFRLRPGAPSSSIDIASSGDVGIGTSSPDASLHISRTDGSALLLVEDTSATRDPRTLILLENNGAPMIEGMDTASGQMWFLDFGDARVQQAVSGRGFGISLMGTGGYEFRISQEGRVAIGPGGTLVFDLEPDGDLIIAGMLTEGSSRTIKQDFVPVDGQDVLAQVAELPLSAWSYKTDDGVRHLGPMAEDFHAQFGLGGDDDRHLAPGDAAGVALAAIQGLHQVMQAKDAQIDELRHDVAELKSIVYTLTARASDEAAPGTSGGK